VGKGDTVVVVPVLNRPHRVEPFLASLHASGAPVDVLFMATTHDDTELAELDRCGATHIDIDWSFGDFARKVNYAVAATTHPYIFVCGDDVTFEPGWLAAARHTQAMTEAGVVGTNDLHNLRVLAGEHATHWLMTRVYTSLGTIDDPSRPLHEGYHHNFVDDELIGTAKHRGAWAYAADSHVEHHHPNYGGAPRDATYLMARRRFALDRHIYETRLPLWT
jgi:hypothetical protein